MDKLFLNAREIWPIFLVTSLTSQLCSPSNNCMIVTNVTLLEREMTRIPVKADSILMTTGDKRNMINQTQPFFFFWWLQIFLNTLSNAGCILFTVIAEILKVPSGYVLIHEPNLSSTNLSLMKYKRFPGKSWMSWDVVILALLYQ